MGSKDGYTEEELRIETEYSSEFEKITFNIMSFECSSCYSNYRGSGFHGSNNYYWITDIEVHSTTEHPYISIDNEEGSFLFNTEGLYVIIWKSVYHQLYLGNIQIAEKQAIKWIEANQKLRFKTTYNNEGYEIEQFAVKRIS